MNWLAEECLTPNSSNCYEDTVFIYEIQIPPKLRGWKTSEVFHYSPRLCILWAAYVSCILNSLDFFLQINILKEG